jgi:hypothetical protein
MTSKFTSAHFDKWIERLKKEPPTVVIRDMAREYGVPKDSLAVMVTELYRGADTHAVHMIWSWDMDRTGRGLTDSELDDYLSRHRLA